MNDQSPDLDLSTSADATRGPISRRTVLAGTAFAVPAIVLTAGTPALAASGFALAFDKASYSGEGCSSVSGAQVIAKDGTTPKAGIAVTVSLASGYTFSNGGTSYTGTTGSGGSVTLPDITVPAGGGTGTATATASGASSATASLVGAAKATMFYLDTGTKKTAVGVPSGSRPVGGALFLTTDGRIVDGSNNGAVYASNVAAFGQLFFDANWALPLRKNDGTNTFIVNGTEGNPVGVPNGSTPVAGQLFKTSDNRLVAGNSGATIASNVDSFGDIYWDGTNWWLPLKKTNGTFSYIRTNSEISAPNIPSGSTPAGANYFLTSDGRLMHVAGTVVSTNVAAYGQNLADSSNNWMIPVRKTDGSAVIVRASSQTAANGVPNGSTPIAAGDYLTSDGRYIDGLTGAVLATGVDKTGRLGVKAGSYSRMPLAIKASC